MVAVPSLGDLDSPDAQDIDNTSLNLRKGMFMGLTDWLDQANNYLGGLMGRKIAIPISSNLINLYLSQLGNDALDGLDDLNSARIVLHSNYFEVIADVTQKGIRADVRMELEIVKFWADFTDHGSGELVLRQRKSAEIQGKGWRDRLTLLVARGILAVAANASLEAWAIGKVQGISTDGPLYTFDLDALGVREKLLQGILSKLETEQPLVEKALKWAAASYALTGATCTEGALQLELSKNEA